jgi:hypothetical protein
MTSNSVGEFSSSQDDWFLSSSVGTIQIFKVLSYATEVNQAVDLGAKQTLETFAV